MEEYLFFDIECADGHNMCSFGYVITAEDFGIKEKRDILVNPECKFKLSRANSVPDINLAYSEAEFFAAPAFSEIYGELAGLLTAPSRVLLGHSVAADLGYIDTACARYNKKRLKLQAFDTQKIYAKSDEEHRIRSLSGIMEDLGVNVAGLSEHKSCDDAEMTMLTVKEICRKYGVTLPELLQNAGDCVVNRRTIAAAHLRSVVNKALKNLRKKYPDSSGRKKIYISETVDPKNADARVELVKAVYRRGWGYTFNLSECDCIVSDGRYSAAEKEFLKSSPQVERASFAELGSKLKICVKSF